MGSTKRREAKTKASRKTQGKDWRDPKRIGNSTISKAREEKN